VPPVQSGLVACPAVGSVASGAAPDSISRSLGLTRCWANVHRTAVAVFLGGGGFWADPSRVDVSG
jgi:hypothetical protein